MLFQMHRIQTESAEVVQTAKQAVEAQDRECQALTSTIQTLEVELRLKDKEGLGLSAESDAKRLELSRLSSTRGAIQQCQLEYENAQSTYDEFMGGYTNKAALLKKQIKDATDQIRDLQESIAADSGLLQDLGMHRTEVCYYLDYRFFFQ
jgi:chromosome segregation ATPase